MSTLTLAVTNMHMDTADWLLMALGLLVFAALLLWVGSTLAGDKRTSAGIPAEEDAARELLDRRLARGELTVEQHEEARRIITSERKEAQADVLA
jgi:uncharacterized membrane protein